MTKGLFKNEYLFYIRKGTVRSSADRNPRKTSKAD